MAHLALDSSGAEAERVPAAFLGVGNKGLHQKKEHSLGARKEANGTLTIAFERMQPVGVSNNHRSIAIPFGCRVIVQIPREFSLCTDGSHGDRAMDGIFVGQTTPHHLFTLISLRPTKRIYLQTGKHFPTTFLSATPTCSLTRAFSQQRRQAHALARQC